MIARGEVDLPAVPRTADDIAVSHERDHAVLVHVENARHHPLGAGIADGWSVVTDGVEFHVGGEHADLPSTNFDQRPYAVGEFLLGEDGSVVSAHGSRF